jgi:glycosyltransferase involved in cell wall biosynthesis
MIQSNKKYKLALVGYRLSGGGSDKVMANLSVFFDSKGIDVHIITVLNEVSFPFKGKLVNLGLLKNESNGIFNKLKRFQALNKYIKNNSFDYIIDFRFRTKILQELVIARFIYPRNTIFTVHSYLINHYMPNISWLTRLMYNHSFANVVIVKEMKEYVYRKHRLQNLAIINNSVNFEEIEVQSSIPIAINFEYIIAIGQYENPIKQFDKLIISYANSVLPKENIHLIILGNGDENSLINLAKKHNVEDKLHLLGFQENPFNYLKNALYLVLSSKNEGFSNVLIESLACETPVISLNCPCGPKEIVINNENGILVEDQDFEKLTEAMNTLFLDKNLYQICKQNAKNSVEKFSLETIGNQWLELMKIES